MTVPPVIDPILGRFVVLTYWTTCECEAIIFHCTTDAPCHLWANLADTPPILRRIPYKKRGADMSLSSVTCFVPIGTYEQNESGDTLTHTIELPIIQFDVQQYWYLIGTYNSNPCQSISQFFHAACPECPPPVETDDKHTYVQQNRGYCQGWNAQCQSFRPIEDYALRRIAVRINQYALTRKGYFKLQLREFNGACWAESILWQKELYSLDMPEPGDTSWSGFNVSGVNLITNHNYRILAHTIPPWYVLIGDEWIENYSYAAMMWWGGFSSGKYPRGDEFTQCNIEGCSGSWKKTGWDLNFICYK